YSLQTLEERRNAMDALATSFTARADDIDTRMRTFADSIAETVNETERRLVSARRTMEELLSTSTSSVNEALDTTATSINTTLAQTTEHLQTVLNNAAEQVQSALSSTTGDVEKKLGEAAAMLENALGGASERIAGQLEAFTGTASSESEKASDALRQTQQTMILEMQQALAEATRRFNETAEAMRAT